ncbi:MULTISPECIES: hypothetical protein [Thermomonospora]|uniref:Uncharacterized protein n=1 Tax=Thermomonospora cellulosilytica TaxID=1411118 RepID=A0A7W3MUG5_9ACTN|nr:MULTISPECIES: hypothetical protein [Thermomonospora]MBA9002095.1 hypothetical protein [Thermomonospora cellulosilytica]
MVDTSDLEVIGDAELVEELSMLTTQTARMRARMADIVAELDRRRRAAARTGTAASAHRARR